MAKIIGVTGFQAGPIWGHTTTWIQLRPPSKPPEERGKLDDLHVTRSEYGAIIPQVWGRMRLGGNVIWSTDLVEHTETTQTTDSDGAIQPIITYRYTLSCAVAICRGPIVRVRRIWADDRLIYHWQRDPVSRDNIAVHRGTAGQDPDATMEAALGAGNVPAHRGLAYAVFTDFDVTEYDNKLPELSFEIETGAETVETILADLFGQVGLEAADYDLDGACNTVAGFILRERAAVHEAVQPLLQVYATDLAEMDGQIVAVHQGCPALVTVDADDLGAAEWQGPGGEAMPHVETLRQQDLELPGRYEVTYLDPGRHYETSTQHATRYAKARVEEPRAITVPIALTADEARQVAERSLYQEWLGRTQFTFSLPPKYLRLAPGTPLSLPVGDDTVRAKLIGMDLGLFGELRCAAVLDADYVLTQEESGAADDLDETPFADVFTTTFVLWSVPEVRDLDGLAPGFYVAGTGDTGWLGATIYYSADSGATWTVGGFLSDPAVFGEATSALPDGTDPTAWDESGTVDVDVNGTLASSSQSLVDAGANYALLGSELIGFTTVTGADGSYTLSELRRGKRSTSMTGHASGDAFVLITPAVVRVPVPSSLIGQTVLVKCVSDGQILTDVTAQSVTIGAPTSPFPLVGPGLKFNQSGNSQYVPLVFR